VSVATAGAPFPLALYCVVCRRPISEDRVARGSSYCSNDCRKAYRLARRDWRASRNCRLCGRKARKSKLAAQGLVTPRLDFADNLWVLICRPGRIGVTIGSWLEYLRLAVARVLLWSDIMSVTMTVTVTLVPEGEYRVSIPLAPSSSASLPGSAEGWQAPRKEDKVLPLGSSTLSPGLRLPLAT